jgi:hypothetical protein
VCRRSWNRVAGSSARLSSGQNDRRIMFPGSMAVPAAVVKTRPVSRPAWAGREPLSRL